MRHLRNEAQITKTELINNIMTKDEKPIDDIAILRAQIDAIDIEIARLLVKRTDISQAVAFSKIKDAKTNNSELNFGWRPKREIEILRQVKAAEPSLGRRLSYMIWRAMITRNLASQAPMEVVCVQESQAASRIGFGAAVVPKLISNSDEALGAAIESQNLILSLPWPSQNNDWWLRLLEPQFRSLKINMALPHVEDKIPEALCLATIVPLETGNDYSLIAAPTDAKLDAKANLIATKDGYNLWHATGFHADWDRPKENIYFLGAYAIV